jgi:hypothetical protein
VSTITIDHTVLEQALEALQEFGTHYEHCPRYPTWARPELQPPCNCGLDSNVAALRAALAQEGQEPVAWRYKGMIGMPWSMSDDGYYVSCKRDQGYIIEPLYAHPPHREWQGLTEEEIRAAYGKDLQYRDGDYERFALAILAKLKEKNNG